MFSNRARPNKKPAYLSASGLNQEARVARGFD